MRAVAILATLMIGLPGLLVACQTRANWNSSHAPPPGAPSQAPEWVETGNHPVYPRGQFGVGFGVSDAGGEAADERAREQIQRVIEAAIRHEVRRLLAPAHGGFPPQQSDQPQTRPDPGDDGDDGDDGDEEERDRQPPEAGPGDILPADILAGVSQIVLDLALDWLPSRRVDWYTDGFTTYVLHAVDLADATRNLRERHTSDDSVPAELAPGVLIPAAAARVVLGYLQPDATGDSGADGPDPWLAALAEKWRDVAEYCRAIELTTDAGALPLRIRRGEPVQLTLRVRCGHVPADGVRFVRLHAENLAGVCTLSLGASPTPGGRRYIAPPAPTGELPDARTLWLQGMDLAASADNLVPVRVIPLEAPQFAGRLRLRVSDVPAAFERWWLTFPVPELDLPWRVPSRDDLHWRSEVQLIVDGQQQPPELMIGLLRALLIRAGFDDVASRLAPSAGADDEPETGARAFTLTFRGQVIVTTYGRGSSVRSAVEIDLDDAGPSLDAVPVRADAPNGDAIDALRQALSRPSAAQAVRRAINRATK